METSLEFWQILVLAVVQGVTEFLPVSSSGHLVVVASLMTGGDARPLEVSDVNVVLHVGTLGSVIGFYWQRILRLLGEDRRTVLLLLVGTVPAGLIGVPLKLFAEGILESPYVTGVMLVITGVTLIWAARLRPGATRYQDLKLGQALLVGVFQAAAVLPGLSRSGSTIAAGLQVGLKPQDAATFSFLLAIPAIAAAGLLEVVSQLGATERATPLGSLAAGLVVSLLVGYFSLCWLVRWLETGRLQRFAWWCIPLGVMVLVWQWM